MLELQLVSEDHVRRYSIALAGTDGWEISLEEDRRLRWRETCSDWHRVERMRARLQREVSQLVERGWRLEPAQSMNL